ncbi:protein kinase [Paenalkalicoccus suaedae]|uniref:Protein kinase n=1 Tax=Paenalkalicoccus suaedae TaxID=2592382 RepID=A0A859FAH8_9BACI|nr:protein kinase [Paenalkalicoccus suaedae]QKS69772.1 protein kinase [Paenalkalicoccus suaedae]
MHWVIKQIRQRLLDKHYAIGDVLAERYSVESVLQNGSYGIIYLCLDLRTDVICVVKQMRKSKRRENKENYLEETSILTQLRHEGIPKLLDVFVYEGESFFTMEYVTGKNVEDTLFATDRTYTEIECLTLLKQLTEIVCYIHAQGVFHGDIRIPNVLVDNGAVHLIDFGLASSVKVTDRTMCEQLACEDFFDLGDFLLYLLYSSYEGPTKKNRPWTEELVIHPQTTILLKRLLQIDSVPYVSCEEVLEDLDKAIVSVSSDI